MKAFTDIQQSKKLAEILPLESADMEYLRLKETNATIGSVPFVKDESEVENSAYNAVYDRIPCWSLTALLALLPTSILDSSDDHYFRLSCNKRTTEWYDNAIDACYEMIIRLNELKML